MHRTSAVLCIRNVLLVISLALIVSCSRQAPYPAAARVGDNVEIPIDSIANDTPQFYSYAHQGKRINYFVLRLDGRVFACLDACASCYPHRRGYRHDDGAVVCGYCNQRFPLNRLETGIGGCYPIRLVGVVEANRLRIPVASLEAAADKF